MAQLGMFATAGFVHAVLFWGGEGGCAFPFTTRNFESADGYVALTYFLPSIGTTLSATYSLRGARSNLASAQDSTFRPPVGSGFLWSNQGGARISRSAALSHSKQVNDTFCTGSERVWAIRVEK